MIEVLALLPGLIIGVILHEMGHGYAALKFGDDTAKREGRLDWRQLHTHVDPIGTLVFPLVGLLAGGFIFGWARPVPIRPNRFSNYKTGMLVVSLAGVAANFALALVSALFLNVFDTGLMALILIKSVQINCILGVFNLLPIPPLDGSKVIATLFPSTERFFYESEQYGMFIIIGLIFIGAFKYLLIPALLLTQLFLSLA